MNIAIIPARSGSKRIIKKNVRLFAGKHIISYSIKAALDTKLFYSVIVSTDTDEIADVAKSYGADVPFIRPSELANDFARTEEVLLHTIQWFQDQGQPIKYLCCIYATAPLIRSDFIIKGYEILQKKEATVAFSVTSFQYPIFRALRITENDRLKMFWPKYKNTRSNDLPEAYQDAGQFYWVDVKKFIKEKQLFSNNAVPVIIPRYLVQDIDTPDDWEMAEKMYYALTSLP